MSCAQNHVCEGGRVNNKTAGSQTSTGMDTHQSTIQSVVTFSSAAWFNSLSVKDRKKLERIVKQAQRIIGDETGNIQNVHVAK